MNNIDKIHQLLDSKLNSKPKDVRILEPNSGVSPEDQADLLIQLLSKMYVNHGITKNREPLIKDIASGVCACWFAIRDNIPLASAALIKQPDGAAELGRAVSFEKGLGGLVIMAAAFCHLASETGPLIAEVRVANKFKGIPSGEATQHICFDHLDLNPHAAVPMFGHGDPFRQEMFVLSSSDKIIFDKPIFLPSGNENTTTVLGRLKPFISSGQIIMETSDNIPDNEVLWQAVKREPFSIIIPIFKKMSPLQISKDFHSALDRSHFNLIPIEACPTNLPLISATLSKMGPQSLIFCGIDRLPGPNGHPTLLFGHLKDSHLLAPSKLTGKMTNSRIGTEVKKIEGDFKEKIFVAPPPGY